MTTLTTRHEKAFSLLFAKLVATATEQREAFLGTPGNLTERTNDGGTRFWIIASPRRHSKSEGARD